ncbi:NAD/NADP octopine/nopaline dehydrogenase [Elusimicrobium minutum Pei191]|uniref:NAD/NADP octopine/nopaline dehydrogenase n=1 Tax=Elusimicrobium minutum (strain Pei191) TaxID=445932 RepID=B2KD40_ELUMP|nr:NAD/NADP octopine/nopaline dehydrogenase family protein [Elusimicrobium minutum]ACC98436.1 NAD/NADP octopine/nopaline dehydrogenase [Elusimicrobium minutum Pei191]
MKIAVLGSGHGGVAMSADLALSGYDVSLAAVEEHSVNIKLLRSLDGIKIEGFTSSGKTPQFTKPKVITEDVPFVLKDADIIMVIVPSFAQSVYTDLIIKHGKINALVLFPCGGFSALEFRNKLKILNRENDFIACETSSFIYTTKITGPGKVLIKGIKDNVYFAAAPSERTGEALSVINQIYPQFKKVHNVWQTSFSNPSAVLHTIPTLLNMSRIEQMGPYRYSHYDITPCIGKIMEAVDRERVEIAKHLFPNPPSFLETMCKIYNLQAENIYQAVKSVNAYNIQFSPDGMKHRYVTEDIPYSLVPIATIGKELGIDTHNMDAVINIACMANGENYWLTGRNAQKIGFEAKPKIKTENLVLAL